ncbi:MAG: hypothetical protein RIR62_488 [Pseudomonadota bacterium]
MPTKLIGTLLGILAFGLYAVSDISLKWLGAGLHPLQILFFSGLFALPLILAYGIASNPHQALRPRHPGISAIRAGLTVVNSMVVIYAFGALPLAQAYAIFFTMPLFIAALAVPMLGERLDPVTGGAILLGLAGVVVALQPGTMPLEWGHLAALAGALTGALNSILIRRTREESYLVLSLYPMAAQLAVAAAAMPFIHVPMQGRDLAVTGLQALAGVAGTIAFIEAYRRATAATVAPMQYSQIIWATILGYLIFGERPLTVTWIGIGLIVAAGLVVLARQGGDAPPLPPDASLTGAAALRPSRLSPKRWVR